MLSRAMTRRTLTRSGKSALEEGLGGDSQPVLEPDPSLPAQQLAGSGHVGVGVADVPGPFTQHFAFDGSAEDRPDRFGELLHAGGAPRGDVDDRAAHAV